MCSRCLPSDQPVAIELPPAIDVGGESAVALAAMPASAPLRRTPASLLAEPARSKMGRTSYFTIKHATKSCVYSAIVPNSGSERLRRGDPDKLTGTMKQDENGHAVGAAKPDRLDAIVINVVADLDPRRAVSGTVLEAVE